MGLFSFVGGLIGAGKQAKATKKAAQLQYDAAQAGIRETARQFDTTRADFAPYQAAGREALDSMTALLGLSGADQQQSEIDALRNSPLYQTLYRTGEEAVLSNAAATGGLRGGNTTRSLYNLGEDTLSSVIANQLSNYGGLVGVGTGAAGAVGNFGANAVAQQANLRNQGAGAQAQSALVRGGLAAQNWMNAGTYLEDTIRGIIGGFGGGKEVGAARSGTGGFDWSKVLM